MARWLALLVLLAALSAGLAACGSSTVSAPVTTTTTRAPTTTTTPATRTTPAPTTTTTPAPVHRPNRYTLTIAATRAGSTGLVVTGRTNLPDGALVFLGAAQAFRYHGEHATRETGIATKTVRVSHGAFSATLAPFDYRTLLAGLTPDTSVALGQMDAVDNAVTVCASFETGYKDNPKTYNEDKAMPEQPDPAVRQAVGPRGEYLRNSPQHTVFGSSLPHPDYWLEALARAPGAGSAAARVQRAQGSAPTVTSLKGFCWN